MNEGVKDTESSIGKLRKGLMHRAAVGGDRVVEKEERANSPFFPAFRFFLLFYIFERSAQTVFE